MKRKRKNVDQLGLLKERPKSATNPVTQTTSLCEAWTLELSLMNSILTYLSRNKDKKDVFNAIAGLMFCNGLRASEVLDISSSDVGPTGMIKIRGKKGSNNLYVRPLYCPEFWHSFGKSNYKLSDTYSRFWLYREYKKKGWLLVFGSNRKASVTHVMRHLHALQLRVQGASDIDIQNELRHISSSSLEYYVRKGKK